MTILSTLVVFGRRGLVCALLVGLASSLAIADHLFLNREFPVGQAPASVVIGDLDGDGQQDLAVANWYSHDISVLLGNGDGSFATQTRYEAGDYPVSVAIGDFDSDGQQDLAVANQSSYDVSVLLGNGDGSFATQTRYPAGNNPYSVAIGDFDGDGQQDLAVANQWSRDVSVLLGNGDGSFATQTRYEAGGNPVSVAIADLDGDGRQDLAVANGGVWPSFIGDVAVLLGNGDGSFATPTHYEAGDGLYSVAIGDFDSDGQQDLAVANQWSYDVSVLLGNGDGSFATQTRYEAGDRPLSVAIGDLDGDGRQDLAVANRNSHDVSVLLGNGDGSFATQTRYEAGDHPLSVAIGDLDGDGRQDLAVTNVGTDEVSVLLNRSYLPVQTDIRSNSINPYGRGVVPVAIFGSGEFDVTQIDVTSLRFGPNEAECAHDLNDPFDYNEHVEDMNLDGYMDLMTHYRVEEMGIACGDTEVTLAGQTLSGQFFEGTDSIRTVGCTSSRPVNRRQQQRLQLEDRQRPPGPVKPKKVE